MLCYQAVDRDKGGKKKKGKKKGKKVLMFVLLIIQDLFVTEFIYLLTEEG